MITTAILWWGWRRGWGRRCWCAGGNRGGFDGGGRASYLRIWNGGWGSEVGRPSDIVLSSFLRGLF